MNNSYTSETFDERDEYPKATQADLDRSKFRVGLKPAPGKRRGPQTRLDAGLVEYFKAQAGERGYQTLINETLRQAVERDDLEEWLLRIIREEVVDVGVAGARVATPAPDTTFPPERQRLDHQTGIAFHFQTHVWYRRCGLQHRR